jgi:hypothetical protein
MTEENEKYKTADCLKNSKYILNYLLSNNFQTGIIALWLPSSRFRSCFLCLWLGVGLSGTRSRRTAKDETHTVQGQSVLCS